MSNLYVSTNGSDSNSGSQSAPFATIAAASAAATSGTTIYVEPGTYTGGFTTSANGVTYVSTTPGGAIISGGGDTVWTNTGSDVTISGFSITGPSARIGLYDTGGSNVVFENNQVHDICTNASTYSGAVSTQNGGAGILMDNWGSGGYGTGAENGSVIGNEVYNIGTSGDTDSLVQGIYMVQSGTVANNVVYNISSAGIQDWHGGDNTNIMNNTIYDARDGGIVMGADAGTGTASGLNVGNNIIADSAYGVAEEGSTGQNAIYNNLVYDDGSNPMQMQNGDSATATVSANPDFVSAASDNFQLQAGSPAIGAGSPNFAPATDYAGNARPSGSIDIGAFQYSTDPSSGSTGSAGSTGSGAGTGGSSGSTGSSGTGSTGAGSTTGSDPSGGSGASGTGSTGTSGSTGSGGSSTSGGSGSGTSAPHHHHHHMTLNDFSSVQNGGSAATGSSSAASSDPPASSFGGSAGAALGQDSGSTTWGSAWSHHSFGQAG